MGGSRVLNNWHKPSERTAGAVLAAAVLILVIQTATGSPADQNGPLLAEATAPTTAGAQPAGNQLSEIVVTAERREERLQDAPVAVTALTGPALENQGIATVEDLTAVVPNLNYLSSTGQTTSRQAFVFIRGIGQPQDFINNDPGVAMYVDGVYIGRSQGALFDVLNLDRVEVLRGPQGTLYGRNAIGGAINIISQAPSAEPWTRVNFAYGNYNQITTQVITNQGLMDSLFGSLALERTSHDGYVQPIIEPSCPNCNRKPLSNDNTWGGRAALRLLASDALTVDWTADYTRRHDLPLGVRLSFYNANPPPPFAFFAFPLTLIHGRPPASYANPTPLTSETSYTGYDNQQTYGSALTITAQTAFGSLKSITAWRGLQIEDSNNGTGSPLDIFTNSADAIHQSQYSEELQLISSLLDKRLELVTGLYGYVENARENQTIATFFADLEPCFNPNASPLWGCPAGDIDHYKYRVGNMAAYENATFHITPSWSLAAGLRYSFERKHLRFADDVNPILNLDQSKGFTSWTPRVSLSWQATPEFLIYASYAEGYKSGNFNSGNFGPLYVKPETVKAYELGVKSEWLDRRLVANLAGFYSDYSQMQLQITGAPPLHAFANAAKSTIYGAEFETRAAVGEHLRFDASAGYTHTRIEQVDPAALDVTQGARLPFVPDWTLNAGSDLLLSVPTDKHVDLRLEYQYVGVQTGDANDTPVLITPGRSIFNLRGTFSGATDRWELYAYVDNLGDKRYATVHSSVLATLFAVAADGPPRTYGGGFRLRF